MMKYLSCKRLALAIIVIFILLTTLSVFAQDISQDIMVDINQVNVDVNGNNVNGNNFIYDGTTYVPLREIAEMFGKNVSWNEYTNTANIDDATTPNISTTKTNSDSKRLQCNIQVMLNQINVEVSGVKVEGDNILYNDTTYVPLRKIAEMLNKDVTWISTINEASISDKKVLSANEKVASNYIQQLVSENYVSAVENFDSTMKSAAPSEKLNQIWNSIITQCGAFKQQVKTRSEKVDQYDVIFATCEFENAIYDLKVVINNQSQISGFFIVPAPSIYSDKLALKNKNTTVNQNSSTNISTDTTAKETFDVSLDEKKLPTNWSIEKTIIVPSSDLSKFSSKLGGNIVSITNYILKADGQNFQINIMQSDVVGEAKKIYTSLTSTKGTNYVKIKGNYVVEYVVQSSDDKEIMIRVNKANEIFGLND